MQIFKFQRRSCNLSFLPSAPPPPTRALRRAGSRAMIIRQDKAAFETSFNKKKKKNTQTHNEELFQFLITLSYKYGLEIDLSNIAGTVTSTPVSKRMLCVSHLSYSCQGEKKLWSSKNVYYILLQESISHMIIVVGKARENGRNIVGCYMLRPFAHPQCIDVVGSCFAKFETSQTCSPVPTGATLLDATCCVHFHTL